MIIHTKQGLELSGITTLRLTDLKDIDYVTDNGGKQRYKVDLIPIDKDGNSLRMKDK